MSAPAPAPAPTQAQTPANAEKKLSPAEMKKRAKAEKQARRAMQKGNQPQENGGGAPAVGAVNGEVKMSRSESGQTPKSRADGAAKAQHQRNQSVQDGDVHKKSAAQAQQQLPLRRRLSQSASTAIVPTPAARVQKPDKRLELFSHLYSQPRRHSIDGVSKDVHPAVLALGFQMSSYELCGSSARCVAMLSAFKEAIQTYSTPAGTSLARHMTSHYLSPQIDFLKTCRPISESMGNAIRWLKKLIVEIDPNTPEQEAKDDLCDKINTFIHERITVTDQAIASSASSQIKNGSIVLTYAKSSIVEQTLLEAHSMGTTFRVIVIDSRPLFEGRTLATSLVNAGLSVQYFPFSAISHAVKQATIAFFGAHSMLSNGRLQSRVGTAPIAMRAAKDNIPVIILCESVKFSSKVALDSIVQNEVAPSEELLLPVHAIPAIQNDAEDKESQVRSLHDWKDIKNLQVLNLMYDVTPAEYIRMVICEYGSLPPSSVPVVHRLANEGI